MDIYLLIIIEMAAAFCIGFAVEKYGRSRHAAKRMYLVGLVISLLIFPLAYFIINSMEPWQSAPEDSRSLARNLLFSIAALTTGYFAGSLLGRFLKDRS